MEETWAERTGGSQEGAVEWSFQETQGTQWRSGGSAWWEAEVQRWWVKVQLWGTKEPSRLPSRGASNALGRFKPGGRGGC